ncbi:MAG: DMT family transporter [Alphaproteobacteria bacterium]|nr:DMT family transporter [Alphaproteobacteria bacterium]
MPLADRHPQHARGVGMMVCAAILLSSTGPFLRHMESADAWQVQFWRSITMTAVVIAFVAWRWRGDLRGAYAALPWPAWALGVLMGGSFALYLLAMTLTTIANVVFLLAIVPFLTALFAWLLHGERVRRATAVAMVAALAGVALMIGDGVNTGHLTGIMAALAAIALHSLYLATARRYPAVDFTPVNALAGIAGCAIGGVAATTLAISTHDLALSLLLGAVSVGIPFILMILATRTMPAAEVALIGLLESVLGPLWVWLLVGETPAAMSLVGGAIVLGAVVFQALAAARSAPGA